jgi:putative transcriptional regulator
MNKEKFNKQLGAFVKYKRQELSLSQADLAAKMENNAQNISRLERGEVSPTYYWIFNLSEAFGQSPNEFTKEFEKFMSKDKK